MEYQKILLFATLILVAVAVFFMLTAPQPPQAADSGEAESLLRMTASFGKGLGGYSYSYTDVSDGYTTSYALSDGAIRVAEVQNPLSVKRVFLSGNDTVFCIRYPPQADESCASIAGDAEMENYVAFIQTKFFNDTIAERSGSNIEYLLSAGYLSVEPGIEETAVGPFPCRRIRYTIDYRNLSLDEAARFSISSNSPKLFGLSACVDNSTGMSYETTLEYSDGNVSHLRTSTVTLFDGSPPAQPDVPANLSGDPISILYKEREQQVKLATCHTEKQGAEREKCVSDLALILKRADLCELAGSRRDRCMVSVVPMAKDPSICPKIDDGSFRDDCYIELAGALKDSSYCAEILDAAKAERCQGAAIPENETNSTIDIDKLLDYIDKYDSNQSNGTGG
ncbi:MAG: hypothetical protein V1827_00630 [Candidatus Micrarchaeota archaeon]